MDTEFTVEQRTFEDGNVVLFKRANSNVWQARIRRFKGQWKDYSTKETDFTKATKIATDKYKRIAWLQENNEVDVTAKFKDVAALTIKHLEAELKAGSGKQVYKDYVGAITKYLIPCFGNTLIHKIDHIKLSELEKFRTEKIGHLPNRSTINTHNAALNNVFKTAISKGYMLPIQVPQLQNKGAKPKSRPYFSAEEYKRVTRNLTEFAKIGHQQQTREIRKLLRDYVLILANTGMRTGNEALSLKWCNIKRVKINRNFQLDTGGEQALELSVTGKTGRRTLIARDAEDNVTKPLKRIQQRFDDLKLLSEDDLFKRDEFVFRLPDGELIKHERLTRNFNIFLRQYNLLTSIEEKDRSLYSIRHTYATFALTNGIDMETLAVQMGTSITMLERHYSKFQPYMKAGTLGGYEKKAAKEKSIKKEAEDAASIKRAGDQDEMIKTLQSTVAQLQKSLTDQQEQFQQSLEFQKKILDALSKK